MRDYAERIEKKDALQAHPEYLNEQINDHDKAIYAKGWNDCNKEYYNAITELPVASIACTDLSMRLRRTFEADELVNQRILLEAADAIEELLGQHEADAKEIAWLKKCVQDLPKPQKWISVKKQLPKDGEFVLVCNDDGHMMIAKHESEVLEWYYKYTNYDFDIWENEEQGPICYWMPLPLPPKGVE